MSPIDQNLRPPTELESLLNGFVSGTSINIRQAHSTIEAAPGGRKNAITILNNGTRVSFFIHNLQLIDEAQKSGITLEKLEPTVNLYDKDKFFTKNITALLRPENQEIVGSLVKESIAAFHRNAPVNR